MLLLIAFLLRKGFFSYDIIMVHMSGDHATMSMHEETFFQHLSFFCVHTNLFVKPRQHVQNESQQAININRTA